MPTSRKEKGSSWARIIPEINAPLRFYALALLIVEAFLEIALVAGNLEAGQKTLALWAGLGMFLVVVCAVTWLVSYKPKNIIYDKDAHLKDHGKVRDQEEPLPEAVFSKTESGAILEAFLKPNGKVNKKNHKKLKTWMEANELEDLRVITFLVGKKWEPERIQAIDDLDIPKQLSAKV